jgi:putative FmdB family regulatory protein
MPIYAYRCNACGAQEEHIQRFSDPPMTTCESCGGSLEKQLSAAAFHLKGGGWYKDGYASTKPASGSDSGSEKKTEKKAEKKPSTGDGGSKPAAKAAAE